MAIVMKGNFIFVKPGEKAFKVASNLTNYIELGAKGTTEYYLEARIEDDAFIINATLFDPDDKAACRIVNNFPEKSKCRKEMTPSGYRIVTGSGELLFGIDAQGEVCHLKGAVYGSKGEIIAQEQADDFLIYQGPAILGKSGSSLGIVLG